MKALAYFLGLLLGSLIPGAATALPEGFVYLDEIAPGIKQEMRYFGSQNFVGAPVEGYLAPRCILSRPAALGLAAVQSDLEPFGLSLKVFDCYRPQRAVAHFVRWAGDIADTRTKTQYYPEVDKDKLFEEHYISPKSGHTRGSTVDLTIAASAASDDDGEELDMGTPFDFFGHESWAHSAAVGPEQRSHRLLLRTLMIAHGFSPYDKEWWHFSLSPEPYPETYFDFPVE